MTIEDIKKIIPHRYPFLLVDRVVEKTENSIKAYKNVTVNEEFFNGHFPGQPIMPGVLLCEACFQTGAIFLAKQIEKEGRSLNDVTPVLSRISDARFKQMTFQYRQHQTGPLKSQTKYPLSAPSCENNSI